MQRAVTIMNTFITVVLCFYAFLFYESLQGRWFHPSWTTDDALQQLYFFHDIWKPVVFEGDLITEVMRGYLAPLAYWITYFFALLSGSPVMAGHFVHALQLGLSLLFIFLLVSRRASFFAGAFSVLWLLHTRQIMQRLTAGLPRGWSAVVILSFLYFASHKKHKSVLVVLLAGCLLHPPSTLICALAYGIQLLYGYLRRETRHEFGKPLLTLLLLSPLYVMVTYKVVERPEHIGQMVTLEQASEMPEFEYPEGRFPFVPLRDAAWEWETYAFQAFVGRFHRPPQLLRETIRPLVCILLVALVSICLVRRREALPPVFWTYLIATVVVYFLSRELAFKLYVPNRHIQFPVTLWSIAAFSILSWNAFSFSKLQSRWAFFSPYAALTALGVLVYLGTGMGLQGDANFNYSRDKKGDVFIWLEENTAPESLIAGHPTHIDGTMLFANRRAFITTETAHPFYPKYNEEVRRRIRLSLKAHYARDLQEIVDLLEPEGVDYFIFERGRFYPEALAENDYQLPHKKLAQELGSRNWRNYAYRQVPSELDPEKAPYQVFRDARSVVIDLHQLKRYLESEAK